MIKPRVYVDPTIDEIREIRHRISALCDHDPAKLVAYFQKIQDQHHDRLISSPRFAPPSAIQPTSDESGGMPREEHELVVARVRRWAGKPESNVHKIIALVANSIDGVARGELVDQVKGSTASKNAYGAVASLLTSGGNNYGRVFEDVSGVIRLHPAVSEVVLSFRWRTPTN